MIAPVAQAMAGEHILVIDDCRTVRDLMSDMLQESGYACSLAPDGATGLDLAQARTPDLVLLDFIMPKMNGFQFMQAFRRVENQRSIPVVLVSVKADNMGEKFMRATGAVDALTKPFTREGLLAVVEHALGAPRASDAALRRKPFLSANRFERERVPDIVAESREAMTSIRSRLAGRLGLSNDAEILDEEFIFSLIDDFRRLDPTAGVAAFAGSTESVGVGEIMQLLLQGMAKGTLEIQGLDMRALIYMTDGRVALARLRGGPDEFLLGRYLLKEDLITRQDLRRLLDSADDKHPLGERLIMMGYISRDDLDQVLTEQTTEVLWEVLRWQSARYRFLPGQLPNDAEKLNLKLPVGELLMEGLRRVDEWRVIESKVPDFDVVFSRAPGGIEAVETSLSTEEARVLDFVNGARTVREIISETRLGSFETCKILYQLLTVRAIRKAD